MIQIPVHDRQGNVVETLDFDDTCLGSHINYDLLHQAIVMFEANRRSGTHSTKNRRSIVCSTRKPHRQKGTGRARQGFRRRVGSRGGAVAHGPMPRDYDKVMPKKARRVALRSALLGKFRDGEVIVVDDLKQEQPRTREVAATLKSLKLDKGCLVVTRERDAMLWKSVRNIKDTALTPLAELNPYNVLKRKCILMTKDALQAIPEMLKKGAREALAEEAK